MLKMVAICSMSEFSSRGKNDTHVPQLKNDGSYFATEGCQVVFVSFSDFFDESVFAQAF
jgi:hypothetical protein